VRRKNVETLMQQHRGWRGCKRVAPWQDIGATFAAALCLASCVQGWVTLGDELVRSPSDCVRTPSVAESVACAAAPHLQQQADKGGPVARQRGAAQQPARSRRLPVAHVVHQRHRRHPRPHTPPGRARERTRVLLASALPPCTPCSRQSHAENRDGRCRRHVIPTLGIGRVGGCRQHAPPTRIPGGSRAPLRPASARRTAPRRGRSAPRGRPSCPPALQASASRAEAAGGSHPRVRWGQAGKGTNA
jgi:hypothetical protein